MRNRTRVALAAAATIVTVAATAYLASKSFLASLVAAMAAIATIAFVLAALQRQETTSLNAHSRKHVKPIFDRFSRIDQATRRTDDIAGSVHALRRDVEAISENLGNLATRQGAAPPNSLPAIIEAKKSAIFYATHPGRTTIRSGPLAAAGGETHNEKKLLAAISPDRQTELAPNVVQVGYIGSSLPDDSASLQWISLNPTFAVEQLHQSRPTLILIDVPSLTFGLWANANDALGSRIYLTLWEVLIYARDNSIPTIAYDDDTKDATFSEEIRTIADIVVSGGTYSVGHGTLNNLHVVNEALQALASNKTDS